MNLIYALEIEPGLNYSPKAKKKKLKIIPMHIVIFIAHFEIGYIPLKYRLYVRLGKLNIHEI